MTDMIEKLRKLHNQWQIGGDDDAEMATEAIMEALPELIEELERLRGEATYESEAGVTLYVPDALKAATYGELDDQSLVVMARFYLALTGEVDSKNNALETGTCLSQHIWLIRTAEKTNAQEIDMTVSDVEIAGKPIGDWQITVKQVTVPTPPRKGE